MNFCTVRKVILNPGASSKVIYIHHQLFCMDISTTKKEKKAMTELKLEKQSDLYSLLWHLSVCLHWIPVEFLWGLDMSQVTSKVWGTAVTSVTSIKWVRCPCWELPSFHNCSQGANSMSFFPGAPNLFVFTHTLPCRVNVGPSLYQVSSLKSTLTFWSWKPKKRVEAPKDVLWFWYAGVQVQIILFWARPTGELKQGIFQL